MSPPSIVRRNKASTDSNEPLAIRINIEELLEKINVFEERLCEAELPKGELIETVLLYIADKDLAEQGIESFAEDMYFAHYREFGEEEASAVRQAIDVFAHGLYNKLSNLGAYTSEGDLPYTLIGNMRGSDVVLIPDVDNYI